MMFRKAMSLLAAISFIALIGCANDSQSTKPVNVIGGSANINLVAAAGSAFSTLAKRADARVTAPGMDTIRQALIVGSNSISGNITNIPAGFDRKFEVFVYDSLNKICYFGKSYADVISGSTVNVPLTLYRYIGTGTGNASINGTIVDSIPTYNSPPAVTFSSPANNSTYKQGDSLFLTATASDSDGTIRNVKFYRDSTLLSVDSVAPYIYTMRNMSADTYRFKAVATDNQGATATTGIVTVTVTTIVNKIPMVSLTSPANNSTYKQGDSLFLAATASDSDGTIRNVKFYRDSTLLSVDSVAPYIYTMRNMSAGTYRFKAVATDNQGATATTGIVTVTVTTIVNKIPMVSLTSPANNSTYKQGDSLFLTATASDSDGIIRSVKFYNDTSLKFNDTVAPYAYTFMNIAAGSYKFKAVATDDKGATGTSQIAAVTVTSTTGADITNMTGTIFTARGQNAPNEGVAQVFDNNTNTKWLDFSVDSTHYSWLQVQFGSGLSKTVTSYKMTSANDAPERDPYIWALQGSNDGVSWTTVDNRSAITFSSRYLTQTFTVATPGSFNYYRLYISRVAGVGSANAVQLAELRIIGY